MKGDVSVALERAVAALATYCFGDRTLQETLSEVSLRALDALPSADFVALIVSLGGTPTTTFCTDQRAFELDQVQYEADSGPCLDAFRDGKLYVIVDTRDETRWPAFSRAAVERDVLSTMSLPLAAADRHFGAMNLYSTRPKSFAVHEEQVGQAFSAQASVLLANAQAYYDAVTLSQNLAQAMETRAAIEQAKGIVMATMGCSPDEAFEVLARQSHHENRKLRDIAADLVEQQSRRRR